MPIVSAEYEDLVRLIGQRIPKATLVERVPMMGGAYEGESEGRLHFEFFPNRPDLLSIEGLARACRAFFDIRPGLTRYPVEPSLETVTLDPTVTQIRPSIGFARVDGLSLDDARLADLIEVQERLTTGPGRKRRKVAIGIHDAARVKGPFTYKAVAWDEVRFVPLQMDKALTPREILEQHEKGRLYRRLVEGQPRIPLIVDQGGQVLSMPPVINGQLTALSTRTRDVIVDVTGTDDRAVQGILHIVVAALAERGGRIRSFQLRRGAKTSQTPDLTPQEMKLPYARVTELTGLHLTPQETATYLGRMEHELEPSTPTAGTVRSPAWRLDLLHADDLVEDVAIGYGFERFTPRLPTVAHFGSPHPDAKRSQRARTLLLGLGFTEVVTLTLAGKADTFQRLGAPERPVVEVANALTIDHAILRPLLFPSLLGILRANKHRDLPQSVFEVGNVVPDGGLAKNELRAAATKIASRASFAEVKGVVEAFLRDVARPAQIAPGHTPGFVPGRCAKLVHEGRDVGFFGELHPETIDAFELGAPVYAFEVAL